MSDQDQASRGEIVLYQARDGSVALEVRLERESIWLSQTQMALLFDQDTDTIGLHLRNVFKECELEESATTGKSSVVRMEGDRRVRRKVRFYNLGAIISVGYRVDSRRGTQFRIWATRVLREHIVEGYTVNEARLRDLDRAVRLIAATATRRDLTGDEATALLSVVGDYRRALELLDDYDHRRVTRPEANTTATYALGHEEARRIVERLRSAFAASDVFGVEKDRGLERALDADSAPKFMRHLPFRAAPGTGRAWFGYLMGT